MSLFHDFFKNDIVNKAMNATYVALILKKPAPKKISDYRSISLITSVCKILVKVLEERLKLVLPSTISPNQSTFVRGRRIVDPILIANEIVDWWRCSKQQGIIIKLDVKKAFDKINWKFLLTILKLKGFSNKWINWIYGCISSLGYSILINGSPRGYTSKQSR